MTMLKLRKTAAALLAALLLLGALAAPAARADAPAWDSIVSVLALEGCTVALRADGRVLYAGDDPDAARAFASWSDVVRIERQGGGQYIVGYRADGSVALTPLSPSADFDPPQWTEAELSSWRGVAELTVSYNACVARFADGSVRFLSRDAAAQQAVDAQLAAWPPVTQVAALPYIPLIVGLARDGSVVCASSYPEGEGYWADPGEWEHVEKLYGNFYGIYAIGADGSLLGSSWLRWDNLDSLYFATDSMFGLRRDGTVAVYPDNQPDNGAYQDQRMEEVKRWENVTQLGFTADGWARYLPVALCADGTVRAVLYDYDGSARYGYWDVSGWRGVEKLYSGSYYTVGLCADGRVLATGGEFGSFDFLSELSGWTELVDISVSPTDFLEAAHIVGLRADGTLVAVGNNDHGQCDVTGPAQESAAPAPSRLFRRGS